MNVQSRRAFLGLAQGAIAVAAAGSLGVRFIEAAAAMPIAPAPGKAVDPSHLVIPAQWGPPPRPGHPAWRGRRRGRRWVCWWHRGRRRCGWRW